jgi:predicted acyltransferase
METTFELPRAEQQRSATPTSRMMSLDVLRGLTIAGMILVNNAGDWEHVFRPLEHAEWNGWTPTDLVFPFFLFIIGVSMVLSFGARRERGAGRGRLLLHAGKRSAIILALGLFLNGYPHFNPHVMRIPGVLQRIAVVYFICSALALYLSRRTRIAAAIGLLLGYWALMKLVPVPGYGAGVLTEDGNLAAYLDRALMYNHLYVAHRFDPEGLLSTLTAIVTCLLGVFTGEWIRGKEPRVIVRGLLIGAVAGIALGEFWNVWFPINKNLWTSSYVLFSGGMAMALLAVCYWTIDVCGWKAWSRPFQWYGLNPLAIYALASFVGKASVVHKIGTATLKGIVYDRVFAHVFASPYINSMCYGIAYVLVFLMLALVLYRARIFVRV